MNKKEIAEIRKNFSDDCGFFTVGHVLSAFVDSEKNIKYKANRLYKGECDIVEIIGNIYDNPELLEVKNG